MRTHFMCPPLLSWPLALLGACVLGGCAKTANPAPAAPLPLLYASVEDGFASWSQYLPADAPGETIKLIPSGQGAAEIRLEAAAGMKLGVNRLLPIRRGRAEFEYAVESRAPATEPFAVYAIPLYNSGPNKFGMIEVGADSSDDPRNGFSRLRRKFVPGPEPIGAGQWQRGSLDFDFSDVRQATHTVIAFRINEGTTKPGAGRIVFRNVRIFGE